MLPAFVKQCFERVMRASRQEAAQDANRPGRLRGDPALKMIADRSPEEDLAGQLTLSRFENAVDIPAHYRLQDVLIDQFIASFPTPPARLTFDVDLFEDATRRQPQLTFLGA